MKSFGNTPRLLSPATLKHASTHRPALMHCLRAITLWMHCFLPRKGDDNADTCNLSRAVCFSFGFRVQGLGYRAYVYVLLWQHLEATQPFGRLTPLLQEMRLAEEQTCTYADQRLLQEPPWTYGNPGCEIDAHPLHRQGCQIHAHPLHRRRTRGFGVWIFCKCDTVCQRDTQYAKAQHAHAQESSLTTLECLLLRIGVGCPCCVSVCPCAVCGCTCSVCLWMHLQRVCLRTERGPACWDLKPRLQKPQK